VGAVLLSSNGKKREKDEKRKILKQALTYNAELKERTREVPPRTV
jgi:hypothetical protein